MSLWFSAMLVFIGGGLGSVCRFGISTIFSNAIFPRGTLIANIISCIILGILMAFYSKELLSSQTKLLLMTGFCGGFSTFSTFSAEMVTLYQSGETTTAIGYAFLSISLGLLSILFGLYLAQICIK